MKITITIDDAAFSKEISLNTDTLNSKSVSKKDYHNEPPYKGIMIIKAKRERDRNIKDARIYEFRYNPKDYPEANGLSAGVPIPCGMSSIRVNPNKFHPTSKGLLPFQIIEHDDYSGAGTCYPVKFDVIDFEWQNE